MKSISQRLQELTEKLNNNDIFKSVGLGNEINFYVFDYDPVDEYVVRDYLYKYLIEKKNNILIFDIYDIIIDYLKERKLMDKCIDFEKKKDIKYLNKVISKSLGIGTANDVIVNSIKNSLEPNRIVLITGISKCYGILRGHTILNNLHSVVTSNPLVMFYPGNYNGQSFRLFNIFDNDNYYRAFSIVDRK